MPRTALFVIDIQHALVTPPTAIPHASRVVNAGTQILQQARAAIDAARTEGRDPDLEIVIVQHHEPAEEGDLVRGTAAWEVVFPPRTNDGAERVVEKDRRDTFVSTPSLAAALKSRGVETIVAFGIQSECCVLSTCRGALDAGFRVVLLGGAHSTYDGDGKTAEVVEREVEMTVLEAGGSVVGWEEWVGCVR